MTLLERSLHPSSILVGILSHDDEDESNIKKHEKFL